MNITFTPAAESDLPELLSIARAAAKAPGSHWGEDYPDEETLRWDMDRKALYRIEGDGALMGLISLCRDEVEELTWPTQDENACMMSRLGLHPDYQGKGLLFPVFSGAVAQCRALGYRTLRLLVATNLSRLFRVYGRCGFTRVGQVHLWDQDFYQYEFRL